jgi:hypothetical protein
MKGTLAGTRALGGWSAAGERAAPRILAPRLLEGAVALGILLLAIASRVLNLDYRAVYPQGDEGIRGVQLMLMQAGFRPLGEIYASQGPLLLDLLFPLYQLFGGGLVAARLAVGTYSLLALFGAYWIGRQVSGPLGASAAALMLVLSPTYLENSRLALAEAVALGPALLAVGAALVYARRGALPWLLLAGLLLGLSLLIKPITISAVVPVGLAALGRGGQARRDLLTAGLVVGGVVLVGSLAAGLGGVVDQIVEYRLRARSVQDWSLAGNWGFLRRTLRVDGMAFFGMVLLGAVALARSSPRIGLPLIGWGVAAGLLLLLYSPLFEKHAATLLPPLAILAGAGLGQLWAASRRWLPGRLALLVPIACYAWMLPGLLRTDAELLGLGRGWNSVQRSVADDQIQTIAALTGPRDFVLTDYPSLAFLAERPVPPPLADASDTRVRSDELSSQELIAAATSYPSTVAVLRTQRFRSLEGFSSWFGERYLLVKTYGQDKDIKEQRVARYVYLRRDADLAQARSALTAGFERGATSDFGGVVRLAGYRLGTDSLTTNESTPLMLEWEAIAPLTVDYEISVRLLGENGRAYEVDNDSLRDQRDADAAWSVGRWIVQVALVSAPTRLPHGDYQVAVGVIDPKSDRRLPVGATSDQEMILGRIRVY